MTDSMCDSASVSRWFRHRFHAWKLPSRALCLRNRSAAVWSSVAVRYCTARSNGGDKLLNLYWFRQRFVISEAAQPRTVLRSSSGAVRSSVAVRYWRARIGQSGNAFGRHYFESSGRRFCASAQPGRCAYAAAAPPSAPTLQSGTAEHRTPVPLTG